jgi:hypothetical protein
MDWTARKTHEPRFGRLKDRLEQEARREHLLLLCVPGATDTDADLTDQH